MINEMLREQNELFSITYLCILPVLFWALMAIVGEVVGAEELGAGVALHRKEVEAVASRVAAVAAQIGELHLVRCAVADWE